MEPTSAELPRWARGAAVALVTAPGVLLAQLVTSGRAPALGACLLAAAAVAAVAGLLPSGGTRVTAAVAATAQLAGHLVLAVAVPVDGGGGCLAVVGRGAGALVNPSTACPPGMSTATAGWLAVGTAVLAAAGAAMLVLAGSGALAAVTAALVAGVAAAAAAVRGLLAGVRVALVDSAALRAPVLAVHRVPVPAPAPLRSVWRPGAPARRGPPAVPATV